MNMETVMNFLADNYTYFMIAAGVLLVALIGFLVSGRKKKGNDTQAAPIPQNDFSQMGTLEQAQAPTPAAPVTPIAPTPLEPAAAPAPAQDTIFTGAPVNAVEEEDKLIIEAPSGALNENVNMDTLQIEEPVAPAPVEASPVAPAPAAPVEAVPQSVDDGGLLFETPTPEPVMPEPMMAMPEVAPMVEPMMATPEAAPMPEPVMATPEVAPMAEPVMTAPEAVPMMEASAPIEEMPISMTPEAPAPVAPAPVEASPAAPAPAAPMPEAPLYQNTIQQ